MAKLSKAELRRLVEHVESAGSDLDTLDLRSLICDAGLCPIEQCAYYGPGEVECPHLTQVCELLKQK